MLVGALVGVVPFNCKSLLFVFGQGLHCMIPVCIGVVRFSTRPVPAGDRENDNSACKHGFRPGMRGEAKVFGMIQQHRLHVFLEPVPNPRLCSGTNPEIRCCYRSPSNQELFQEHIPKSRVGSGASPETKGHFRSQSRNQGSVQEPVPKSRVDSGASPETKGHFRSHSRNQEPVQEPVPKSRVISGAHPETKAVCSVTVSLGADQHLEIMEA